MNLFQMGLLGSILILVIILVRSITINRLPKTTFFLLWSVTIFRLLLPFSFSSPFSIYGIFQHLCPFYPAVTPVSETAPSLDFVSTSSADVSALLPSESPVLSPLFLIWAGGFLLCLLFFAVAYWHCRKELLTSLPVENSFANEWLSAHPLKRTVSIRQSDKISAPLTYGLWHPVILLPSKTTDWQDHQQLECIFTHEMVHIRRFDLLFKMLLTLTLCVHWFNPLVWVMYLLANRDLELSCDEQVLHILGEENKSLYAMTLLNMEEQRSHFRPLYNSFSKNSTQERIVSIMKIKKASISGTLAALLVVTCITTAFAASPEKETRFQTENTSVSEVAQDSSEYSFPYCYGRNHRFYDESSNSHYCPQDRENCLGYYDTENQEDGTVRPNRAGCGHRNGHHYNHSHRGCSR